MANSIPVPHLTDEKDEKSFYQSTRDYVVDALIPYGVEEPYASITQFAFRNRGRLGRLARDLSSSKISIDGTLTGSSLIPGGHYHFDSHSHRPISGFVPQKLLVGVEPNPGPPKKGGVKIPKLSETVVEIVRKRKGQRKKAAAQVSRSVSLAAPVSISQQIRNSPANSRYLPNGDVIVTHREYFSEVSTVAGTSSLFSVGAYQISPSNNRVFPWLSKIANNYESYKFLNLRFSYATEQPTSLGGSVYLGVDYDVNDPTPADKLSLMQKRSSVRTAPWAPITLTCVREDLNKRTTFYTGGVPPGKDPNLYSTCNLFVATTGFTSQLYVGELYVEYSIRLMTPQYLDNTQFFARFEVPSTALAAITENNPFLGAVQTVTNNSFASCVYVSTTIATQCTLTFNFTGYYAIYAYCVGNLPAAVSANAGFNIVVGGAITVLKTCPGFSSENVNSQANATPLPNISSGMFTKTVIFVQSAGATIGFLPGGASASVIANPVRAVIDVISVDPVFGTATSS